jgi:hypothetical protein
MNTSFRALHRANPRTRPGFAQSVEAAAGAVHVRIEADPAPAPRMSSRRRRRVHVSAAGASLAVAAFVAAVLTVGLPGGGSGIDSATAAVERAVTVTADSAERSGTAVIRMTHDGQPWAGKTIVWNGADVAITSEDPGRNRKAGSELIVVDGVLYGIEPRGGWIAFGDPRSIDPDSGTTPAAYLAAVREDVGGPTLRRITRGMNGLTTGSLADGSTVYSGTVAAGLVARETGFKEGEALRVLPFGYVAHDQAANPAAPLNASVTVGADGVVRKIAVTWGTWTYTVTYSGLGTTPAPVAPENATPLKRWRAIPQRRVTSGRGR